MNNVGQKERITQNRVVTFFQEQLDYDYLGNWEYRETNKNIETERLTQWLAKQGVLTLSVTPNTTTEKRVKLLNQFYRHEVHQALTNLLPVWEHKTGVNVNEIGVKKMKTKWGSCNIQARRLWLNSELAKKPPECLEYILVHEMVHLLERHHNDRFKHLMDRFMPNWRERRSLLNSLPLAYEDWSY